jgi:hypothetical protein
MNNPRHWTASEEGKRVKLAADVESQFSDIEQEARTKGITPVAHLQNLAPYAEHEGEPQAAAESVLQQNDIVLRDDVANGVKSAPMRKIFEKEHTAKLWCYTLKHEACTGFFGHNQLSTADRNAMTELNSGNFAIADFTAGRAFRRYAVSPLRDAEELLVFPPISSVAASVQTQDGDVIEIPIVNSNAGQETPQKWVEGTDNPLTRMDVRSATDEGEWLAGGLELTSSTRNSMLTSDAAMLEIEKQRLRGERIVVDEILLQILDSITSTSVGMSSPNIETLIQIATLFTDTDYMITTLIGDNATVRNYLEVDRSGLAYNSGMMTVGGSVIGNEMYGKAGMSRMIYDKVTLPAGLATNQLLGFDASKTADMYIAMGSQENLESYRERQGVYEIMWRFKYITTLRVPGSTNGRRLLT